MECKFLPYEGKRPYAFISYCHEDTQLVAAILNRLYDQGLEMWHDGGIEGGEEWDKVVAEKLRKSGVVIAFYTGRYMTHPNCVNEAINALNHNIPLLPLFLEPDIVLDSALDMRSARKNAIRYFDYRDKELFAKKVARQTILRECVNPERTPEKTESEKNGLNPLWPAEKIKAQAEAAQIQRTLQASKEQNKHPYYCIGCCGKVTDDTVLFDMSGMLSENWKLLPFTMTERELRRIQRDGEPIGPRVSQCAMSLGEILSVMADEHNLNNPVVAELSREQLRQWVTMDTEGLLPGMDALSWDVDQFLRLRKELEELLDMLDAQGNVTFTLELVPETRFDGKEVVTSVLVSRSGLGQRMLDKRRCPHCGQILYHRAGAVTHKVITFLGDTGSGKTGAIRAAAHYAMEYAPVGKDHSLWQGAMRIPQLSTVEILPASGAETLLRDYEQKLCPEQTQDLGAGGTSVTFRIREKPMKESQVPQETILTLVELPGTLWDQDGNPDRNRILSGYPIVLDSTAVVACQNVSQLVYAQNKGSRNTASARRTGTMADRFQSILTAGGGEKIPMLLLFTACPDLERADMKRQRLMFSHPVQKIFLLGQARSRMESNPFYQQMMQVFWDATTGSVGYRGELCCSAYGQIPVGAPPLPKENGGQAMETGKPVYIDLLTRWLLAVSGCIAIHTNLGLEGRVTRMQYRSENPLFTEGQPTEAMLRCHLFSNPGVYDAALVEKHDNVLALAGIRAFMWANGNNQN